MTQSYDSKKAAFIKPVSCRCGSITFAIATEVRESVTWFFVLCGECGKISLTLRDEPDSLIPRFFMVTP